MDSCSVGVPCHVGGIIGPLASTMYVSYYYVCTNQNLDYYHSNTPSRLRHCAVSVRGCAAVVAVPLGLFLRGSVGGGAAPSELEESEAA